MRNKITIFFVACFSLLGLSFVATLNSSLPELLRKEYPWAVKTNELLDTLNTSFPMPSGFYDQDAESVLRDSFLISPTTILKVQALAFRTTRERYGLHSASVSVGYGMMPGTFWYETTVDYFFKEAKQMVFDRLIKDRRAQNRLYQWAKPTMVEAYKSKSDTLQALDLIAVWKSAQYLESYNHGREVERSKSPDFTNQDWRGKYDPDAKIYAFWFRRIHESKESGSGFSYNDAKYWTTIACRDMWLNSTESTQHIFNEWKEDWLSSKLVYLDRCRLLGEHCDEE